MDLEKWDTTQIKAWQINSIKFEQRINFTTSQVNTAMLILVEKIPDDEAFCRRFSSIQNCGICVVLPLQDK